jgi:Tfp pilus assembly protein PilE
MRKGLTWKEALTGVVALVVIAAVVLPMWRAHQLHVRRQDAVDALHAVQVAQDEYFGKHARYADEATLRAIAPTALSPDGRSAHGYYRLTLQKSKDELAYSATARVVPLQGEVSDTRCVELRIDQNGRRFAFDADGLDRGADCWK